MTAGAWIALAAVGFTYVSGLIGVVVAFVRLEGRVNGKADLTAASLLAAEVSSLKEKAKEHGDVRDIVIEMRTEMREFRATIAQLGDAIKDLRTPAPSPRRRPTGG